MMNLNGFSWISMLQMDFLRLFIFNFKVTILFPFLPNQRNFDEKISCRHCMLYIMAKIWDWFSRVEFDIILYCWVS